MPEEQANEVIDRIGEIANQVGAGRRAFANGRSPVPRQVVEDDQPVFDRVNHPHHYNIHPSGVECIQITEWMNFNLGNVVKYIWRADDKGATIEDLKKAAWYLAREIARLEGL